jgi:hypothetical protein
MTRSETENLISVKRALAQKYERLARASSSKPAQKKMLRRAKSYAIQARNLSHATKP